MKYFYVLLIISSLKGYTQKKNNQSEIIGTFIPPGQENFTDTIFAVTMSTMESINFSAIDTSISSLRKNNLTSKNLLIYVGDIDNLSNITVRISSRDTAVVFKLNLNLSHKIVEGKHYLLRGNDRYEVVNKQALIPEKFPSGQQIIIDSSADFSKGNKKYFKTHSYVIL